MPSHVVLFRDQGRVVAKMLTLFIRENVDNYIRPLWPSCTFGQVLAWHGFIHLFDFFRQWDRLVEFCCVNGNTSDCEFYDDLSLPCLIQVSVIFPTPLIPPSAAKHACRALAEHPPSSSHQELTEHSVGRSSSTFCCLPNFAQGGPQKCSAWLLGKHARWCSMGLVV